MESAENLILYILFYFSPLSVSPVQTQKAMEQKYLDTFDLLIYFFSQCFSKNSGKFQVPAGR